MQSGTLTRRLQHWPAAMFWVTLLALSVPVAVGQEQKEQKETEDLTNLDLATLMKMDVVVTVASKREQAGGDAPAAVFVLTREDIRRSGARSVPELLRTVPGIQLGRIDNQTWSISARGFNSRFANKMLVLIDGRSIYRSDFGGVVWEEQNVPLEEIERIEVVRGPGGVLWGINAVNGVINIITKRAVDSRSLRLTTGSGNDEPLQVGVGYGGTLGKLGDYRIYLDQFQRDAVQAGVSPWKHRQVGWRFDGAVAAGQLTFQGDLSEDEFSNYEGPNSGLPTHSRGGNVGVTWKGQLRGPGEWQLRTTYDWNQRDRPGILDSSAWGLEAQYQPPRSGRHRVTVGAGARHLTDELQLAIPVVFLPARQRTLQAGLYAQDELYFLADRLQFTLGLKAEHFEHTGAAWQPTVRTLWHAHAQHTLWAAFSRAARAPSRLERDSESVMVIPGDPLLVTTNLGDSGLDFEQLDAYELGWRWRPEQRLSFDLTLFQHEYAKLIGSRALGAPLFDPGPPAQLLITNVSANLNAMRSRGADLSVEAAVTERFRLQASVSVLNQHLPQSDGLALPDSDPKRAASLNARFDLPHRFALDLTERYVGPTDDGGLDSYFNLDARLGWRPIERVELSLSVDNVFDRQYLEQASFGPVVSRPLGRSAFVRVNWEGLR